MEKTENLLNSSKQDLIDSFNDSKFYDDQSDDTTYSQKLNLILEQAIPSVLYMLLWFTQPTVGLLYIANTSK